MNTPYKAQSVMTLQQVRNEMAETGRFQRWIAAIDDVIKSKPKQTVGDGVAYTEEDVVRCELAMSARIKSHNIPETDTDIEFTTACVRAVLDEFTRTPRPAPVKLGDGVDLLQLIRDARHRICNDAPGGIGQRPKDHPVYGPLIRRLDEADAMLSTPRPAVATPTDGMVSVVAEDANNYCRILTALGMEEEGDPVVEVERLIAYAESEPPAAHAPAEVTDELVESIRAFLPLACCGEVCEDVEAHAYDLAFERVEAALAAQSQARKDGQGVGQ